MKGTLLCFVEVSINVRKHVVPGGGGFKAEALASILDCRVGNLLATYLGIPLGAKHKSKAICI